ncbi:MAG: NfeD family protein [Acidimicrobiales bacterium]
MVSLKSGSRRRTPARRIVRGLAGLLLLGVGLATSITPAEAARQAEAANEVRIVEVSGLIDVVVKDYLLRELTSAEEADSLAIVLQLDSHGSVLDDADFEELARRLADSPITVAVWVGPSGSAALGGAAELASLADVLGIAYGSRIGEIGTNRLPDDLGPAFGESNAKLLKNYIGVETAIELGISDGNVDQVAVIPTFLTLIDGFAPLLSEDAAENAQTVFTENQFITLPLSAQLFHTVGSPEVAYLMFVGGLALLIFELYTAGVGVAGLIGAFLIVMGSYGLASLPTRAWAVALLLLAGFALAVDIQTNLPRLYTAIGVVLFVAGSLFLYDGIRLPWLTFGVGLVGVLLYGYTGMPSMVRTRFSTPTIGRQWMIGELAVADSDVDPEGTVRIRDVPWRAITNRATPVAKGDSVRVVGITRMILEVEPETGGARDYRERGERQ